MPTGILISIVLLLAPIVGAMVIGAVGKKMKNGGDLIGIAALGTSLACAITLFLGFGGHGHEGFGGQHWEFTWLTVGGVDWNLGITIDGLTVALLMVVTIVSFLVHLFSKGYMHGDDRYTDFFRWLGLFTFSMLGLVLSDNLLTLFVFWEIMGLASYKLMGHYFFKRSACSWERPASRRSSRCTSGSRTPWRARPRCPPSSTRPRWSPRASTWSAGCTR